ncbi:carboxypeptidase-like regulatory domain-containing protein [Natroniella sulfidigena]|uniref:carboxypeptidase-like regulatory domain-containing protein n=1 Tax=Natroniella sulfidigena TaxID=723921 RepID=UPI00200B2530|nr:carboxypeptidase-like regulatory domain-containing protein [Natroniella sulfidigena]MCK8817066.1 carboxypeptidase-like regulatory domain-containing protein [Natroniella sulfidigena]
MPGYISGTIRDAHDNDPLENVIVNIFQGIMDTQITDENGEFTSIELDPGIYFVQASLQGHQTSPRLSIRVRDGETTNIDINLTPLETAGRFFADRDQITTLSTDKIGNLNIRSEAGQFDELISNEKTPLIELDTPYGVSELRDITTEETGGSVTNNGVEFVLKTAAQADSKATLDSAERGRYQPGNAGETGIAVRLPENPTGEQEARWGYFDDDNGAYLGIDDNGLFVAIRREGVDNKVHRANWNGDPADGTGPSGLNLDLSRGNIFQILYTCYGYGVTLFRVLLVDQNNVQQTVTLHRFKPDQETTFGDPNLPIRGEIVNGATAEEFTMFVAGRQYHVIGRYVPNRRITSERRLNISVNETLIPTVSFRREEDFPVANRSNSVSVKLQSFDIISDANLIYEIRFAPTLTNANFGVPTNTSTDETAVESDTEATDLTGGELIFSGLVSGDVDGPFARIELATIELLDLDFSGLQPVTLALRTVSGTGEASVVFWVREEW